MFFVQNFVVLQNTCLSFIKVCSKYIISFLNKKTQQLPCFFALF